MGKQNQPTAKKFDSQEIDNREHDMSLKVKKVMPYGWNGAQATPLASPYPSVKITVSGTATYIAKSYPGASESSAVWQAKKVDSSSGVVITWADGNSEFDNIASDLTALAYS